ncbi:MAG: hybrid sensor histidine kinase/response regulator, partial [Oscillospiraceae bacterium]
FIEKNYSIWKTSNELRKAPAKKGRVMSQITQIMYSYNLTVDLATGSYSLITGTGMERTVDEYKRHSNQAELTAFQDSIIHPSYLKRFSELVNFDSARNDPSENGFKGTLEYPVIYPGDDEFEWHEINVFIGTEEDGTRIANILGRDITEMHEAQERRENELKAVAAKDQILSDITKTLYSYNLTLNLVSGKYSLILGTGMKDFVKIFEATDDYETAYRQKIQYVTEDYIEAFGNFSSLSALRDSVHETGYIGNLEYAAKTEKGIEWHEINIFLGTDENGAPIINILGRDVTEAHDKADTKAQLEIANASNAAKSAFLFNMSHDIRTPMNAIIGFTELLDKHLDDKEMARNYIKKIQTSNDFLLSLINNVLEMARIESGKTTLDETYRNANTFNDTLYSLFDSQMTEKGIEFTRIVEVIHSEVFCDATKLREIFLNILSNALKYTPSGGKVTMKLTEIPSYRPGYAMFRTEIEDTGIGMSEEFLPHMFDEFTRERSSTESRLNGTGLGMAIVKKLVDLMQGTIKVESHIGKGTKFTVTLPHRIAGKDEISQHIEKASMSEPEKFNGKRILLAEDNALNAEISITILEETGFEVEHASDGIICVDMLEKAEAGYYDVILMDIQMPNMDGYKATRTIRRSSDKKKAGIPIVAMTANAFEEDKKNAYKAGMNGHIAKPINVNELFSTLSEVLDKEEKSV